MKIDRIIAKGQVVPIFFQQQAVADSQSAVAMNVCEAGANVLLVTEQTILFDFEIVGISVSAHTARTAGTLTVDATKNGTATGLQAKLDGTNTTHHNGKAPRETYRGVAGDRVGCKLTTASWTPVTADIQVIVWVLLSIEGI